MALALSLIKRVRELVIGVPALLAWQLAEGKHLFSTRHRRRADVAGAGEEALPAKGPDLGVINLVEFFGGFGFPLEIRNLRCA